MNINDIYRLKSTCWSICIQDWPIIILGNWEKIYETKVLIFLFLETWYEERAQTSIYRWSPWVINLVMKNWNNI